MAYTLVWVVQLDCHDSNECSRHVAGQCGADTDDCCQSEEHSSSEPAPHLGSTHRHADIHKLRVRSHWHEYESAYSVVSSLSCLSFGCTNKSFEEKVSKAIVRSMKKHNVLVAMKPWKTLKDLLVHPKDEDKEDITECVYKVELTVTRRM